MAASAEPGFNVSKPCQVVESWLAQFNQLDLATKTTLFVQILTAVRVHSRQAEMIISSSSARAKLVEGLVAKVVNLPKLEKQQMISELIGNVDTTIGRAYGLFNPRTKLTFWDHLVNKTTNFGGAIAIAVNHHSESQHLQALQANLAELLPDQKLSLLMAIATPMGVDPFIID
jgi:hypothetical protein